MAALYYRKKSIWRVVTILASLLMITVVLVMNVFARYESKASGGASARVAAYESNLTNTDSIKPMPITANGTGMIYQLVINNYDAERICEVRQSYTVTAVNLTGNAPLKFEYYNNPECTGAPAAAATGVLAPGVEQTQVWYMKIVYDGTVSPEVADEIDLLEFLVSAEQIQ